MLLLPLLAAAGGDRAYAAADRLQQDDVLAAAFPSLSATEIADTLPRRISPLPPAKPDSTWWKMIWRGNFNMADTNIRYPKFIKFCVDLYNWGDRTFNSYDTTYVVGTGHRWKFRVVSDNWVDSYAMTLAEKMPIRMMSNIYSNIGAYLQYMAVSYGVTFDWGNIVGTNPVNHKKWEFGFNCARFNAELYYNQNTGGTYLRKFGKYRKGKFIKEKFPGMLLETYGLNTYYFFNNRKYSQGAAYNFSKIQKRSAGSFLIGFSYTDLNIDIDFSSLPENLKPFMTAPEVNYRFHYDLYALLFGYGFNWVITKDLLFNITAMPSIGVCHCYEDSLEGEGNLFSMNINSMGSLTYNMGNIFFSLIGKMKGNWYKSSNYSFFSSIENLSANIGIRF